MITKGDELEDNYDIAPPPNLVPLIHCHKDLVEAYKYHKNIDKIILLNLTDQEIKQKDLDQYVKSSFFKVRRITIDMLICSNDEDDANLISHIKVFCKEDLVLDTDNDFEDGIMKLDDGNFEEKFSRFIKRGGSIARTLNLKPLKDIINNVPVFTYFLLPIIPPLFLEILAELENVTIYRRSFIIRQAQYKRLVSETNSKAYLQFRKDLPWGTLYEQYEDKTPSSITDCFSKLNFSTGIQTNLFFIELSSLLLGSTKRAIIIGSDDFILKYLLVELKKKYGKFYEQDAEKENNEVNLDGAIIFIQNAEQLNPGVYNKLMTIADSEKDDRVLVLQNPVPMKKVKDKSFKVIHLPSEDQISNKLPKILLFIISEVLTDTPKNQKSSRYLHNKRVLEIFRIIRFPSLIEDEFNKLKYNSTFFEFNFSDPDFWWEFKNYIDKKYPTVKAKEQEEEKALEEKKELVKGKETELEKESNQVKEKEPKKRKKKNITFEHAGKFWKITSSGFQPKIEPKVPEPYKNLALKYLTYLVQYCENTDGNIDKFIDAKVLYNKVRQWNKTPRKSKKPSVITVYSQIESYFDPTNNRNKNFKEDSTTPEGKRKKEIRDFRAQLGYAIKEYFVWEKDCYYNAPKDFDIIVKYDKEMEKYKIK